MKNNVVLIGMPGAGKSTVGVVLAKELGYRFVDSDLVMQEKEGKLLHQIISEVGLDGFLEKESEINELFECRKHVIATGGSAIFSDKAMVHLSEIGEIIYIKLPLKELENRIGDLTQRGVAFKAGEGLSDIYASRKPLYEKYADYTVDCENLSIREVVVNILEYLS